jgi:hypothetical protein
MNAKKQSEISGAAQRLFPQSAYGRERANGRARPLKIHLIKHKAGGL